MEFLEGNPVSVLDLDAILVPSTSAKKRGITCTQAIKGKANDPVWVTPMGRSVIQWLSSTTELVFVTERLSPDLVGAPILSQRFAVVAGGFSIYHEARRIDLEWRDRQAEIVRGERELLEAFITDFRRRFGDIGYLFRVLDEQGLPYGLAVPAAVSSNPDMMRFTERHKLLRGHERVRHPGFCVFRRREISFGPAIEHLRKSYPELADRPFVGFGPFERSAKISGLISINQF